MKLGITAALAAGLLTLTACGGEGDDSLGDNAAEAAEAQAENLGAMADNTTGAQAEALEEKAETVEEAGMAKEEAIDESDVDADALSQQQQQAITNAQ